MSRLLLVLFFLLSAFAQEAPAPKPPAEPTLVTGKPNRSPSGLEYYDLEIGTGKRAVPGFSLVVNYTGWMKKGKGKYEVFDSSIGRKPFTFDLGRGQAIKGWDEGFTGMRVGGKRQLHVPAHLGYGNHGSGRIPPNTPLIFDVELVAVR